jgi:hypothetical protein
MALQSLSFGNINFLDRPKQGPVRGERLLTAKIDFHVENSLEAA